MKTKKNTKRKSRKEALKKSGWTETQNDNHYQDFDKCLIMLPDEFETSIEARLTIWKEEDNLASVIFTTNNNDSRQTELFEVKLTLEQAEKLLTGSPKCS